MSPELIRFIIKCVQPARLYLQREELEMRRDSSHVGLSMLMSSGCKQEKYN